MLRSHELPSPVRTSEVHHERCSSLLAVVIIVAGRRRARGARGPPPRHRLGHRPAVPRDAQARRRRRARPRAVAARTGRRGAPAPARNSRRRPSSAASEALVSRPRRRPPRSGCRRIPRPSASPGVSSSTGRSSRSWAWRSPASPPRRSPRSSGRSGSGGFGGKIRRRQDHRHHRRDREGGGFLYKPEGRMWLVEYPETAAAQGAGRLQGPGVARRHGAGIVALYQKCVHLGCRVPSCATSQWFECPCHGSQYNQVGEKKGGPAPRGLDRFAIEVSARRCAHRQHRRHHPGPADRHEHHRPGGRGPALRVSRRARPTTRHYASPACTDATRRIDVTAADQMHAATDDRPHDHPTSDRLRRAAVVIIGGVVPRCRRCAPGKAELGSEIELAPNRKAVPARRGARGPEAQHGAVGVVRPARGRRARRCRSTGSPSPAARPARSRTSTTIFAERGEAMYVTGRSA